MATSAQTEASEAASRAAGYDAFLSYSHAADGRLAPALRTGLARFAKPWYKLRALRVFRDDASLSANPELWRSIEQALASSRWFVLLASPQAAASEWVDREVAWWLDHRGPDRLLIVLTGGELAWDDEGGRLDRERTTALPPTALERFAGEPRYIDLRWAHTAEDVSLANARFRDAVADVAATVHGRPKDELLGEDVRQHRRTRRLVRTTIATLAVLLLAAVAAAVAAVDQRGHAIAQRDRADERARVALSRQLAAEAVALRESQADLALLLAAQALGVADTAQARGALLRSLAASKGLGGLLGPGARNADSLAFAPHGRSLAVGVPGGVTFWDVAKRKQTRRLPLAGRVTAIAFSPEGRMVAAGTLDGRLAVWHGDRLLREESLPDAVFGLAFDRAALRLAVGAGSEVRVYPLRGGEPQLLEGFGVKALGFEGDTLFAGESQGGVNVWDLTRPAEPPQSGHVGLGQPLATAYAPSLTRFAGYTLGSRTPYVTDVASGEPLHDDSLGGPPVTIDALAFTSDAAILAGATPGRVVFWDVESGERRAEELTGHPGRVVELVYGPGNRLLAAAGAGGVTIFDLGADPLIRSPAVPGAIPREEVPNVVVGVAATAFSPDGKLVAWPVGVTEREVVVWDLEAGREILRVAGDGALGFSADSRELAIELFEDDTATVVGISGGKPRREPAAGWRQTAAETTGKPWQAQNGRGLGASLGFDGTLTLWDTRRAIPLGNVAIPGAFDFSTLVFDRAGKQLAVATSGGALSIVDVDLRSWLARACALAGRELTAAEWRRHLGAGRPQEPTCT
jgi:WD40 repeat protein